MLRAQDLERFVRRLIEPLKRRVLMMVGRAVLSVIDDSTKVQTVQAQVLADETIDSVERFQQYGLTSVPEKDCEAIIIFPGGSRAHPVVIATDDRRYRILNLAEGEVCLYTKDHGKRVYCKTDGEVHLGTDPSNFVALANLVKAELDGIKADLDALKTWSSSHTHIAGALLDSVGSPCTGATGVAAPVVLSYAPTEPKAEEVKAK